ncbi:TetR family transcriptional regulator [Aquabacterium sp. A7-Y]|uniref:TetR/AcrR family transcriptional regulator n=1 Tax=Aquabacterium sp. A7-Y TaxID=1349605 RepID=UPI00223E763C|nr:TetR/AcrR family transcriptional regulator [Aquabacterium sp. A7-Y]MCW7540835.1 TetR family transcriptional regulator [Aquabacterium sp. A7-Y]
MHTSPRKDRKAGDQTRQRILEVAERAFIEQGFDALSLRQITEQAQVNLAAVHYHFGGKDALLHAMLERRIGKLNEERLRLLDACEAAWPDAPLSCEHVLAAMFVPAFRLARDTECGGPAFLRLLGRVYTDTSPVVSDYLRQHYDPVFGRFFDAFQRSLPHMPRHDLGLRLHFSLKALAGVLASDDLDVLIASFSQGQALTEAQLLTRLISLMVAVLKEPLLQMQRSAVLEEVLRMADLQAGRPPQPLRVLEGGQQTTTSRPRPRTPRG